MNKECSKCRTAFPATRDYFYPDKRNPDGLYYWCKICSNKATSDWRRRHRHHANRYHRRQRAASPDKYRAYDKANTRKLRNEVFSAYGQVCACCGEGRPEFLSIDHIDGGGAEHRRKLGNPGGRPFYQWLKRSGFPTGFRVLCMNCNHARGRYGYCPHQADKKEI